MTEPAYGGWYWFVLPINPEPWAIGDVSVGRSKGGKMYPIVGRNQQLHFYKEAVKEAIGKPDVWIEGPIELDIYYWRRIDSYKTHQSRAARKNEADTTNLNKATEDALQGLLFKNDKDVKRITGTIQEQSEDAEPCVILGIRSLRGPYGPYPPEIEQLRQELTQDNDNEWRG